MDPMTHEREPRSVQLADLPRLVGTELGVSDWLEIDQERIDRFAAATGDHQWLHTDRDRAAGGPFGTTIAHGYLTLAMTVAMSDTAFRLEGLAMAINYGLDRVRFLTPVKVGSRVRGRFQLLGCAPVADGLRCQSRVTVEIEDEPKPACIAETIALYRR